jgi:threonine aldolase
MRSFRSDNNAGVTPEALRAIAQAADQGHQRAYGDDECTARAVNAFESLFGPDIAVFFVATGTAANTLAIAALTEPWQQVVCHEHSHVNDDESTAPERIAHCRVSPVRVGIRKLTAEDVRAAAQPTRGDVHQPQPGVVTISNATEFGEVYTPAELRAICDVAHAAGYRVHIDGARFANALASIGCEPRELAGDCGVDALSFGGTKAGLALGEAIVFFRQGSGEDFERAVRTLPFHRKATGHLLSKHRFVSGPFAATIEEGSWLRHARHANAMAARLAEGLGRLGFHMPLKAQSNAVFVRLEASQRAHLEKSGHGFYPFGPTSENLYRLMCTFDTTEADVEGLLGDAVDCAPR